MGELAIKNEDYVYFESLHDDADSMPPSARNKQLADKLRGSWNGVRIALITRVDGTPRGRWDSYTLKQ